MDKAEIELLARRAGLDKALESDSESHWLLIMLWPPRQSLAVKKDKDCRPTPPIDDDAGRDCGRGGMGYDPPPSSASEECPLTAHGVSWGRPVHRLRADLWR
jgi:hypothetical protein